MLCLLALLEATATSACLDSSIDPSTSPVILPKLDEQHTHPFYYSSVCACVSDDTVVVSQTSVPSVAAEPSAELIQPNPTGEPWGETTDTLTPTHTNSHTLRVWGCSRGIRHPDFNILMPYT